MSDIVLRLAALAVREHYACEDCWYSCPKSEGGCCDDSVGDECTCGADEHNAAVGVMVTEITEAVEAWRVHRKWSIAVVGQDDAGAFDTLDRVLGVTP